MANALANLAVTLALGAEKNMNVPVCNRWVVAPLAEEFEEEINAVSAQELDEEDWRQPLIVYLQHERLPNDPRHKTEIQRRAPRFLYFNGTLYRRSLLHIWLLCLGDKEVTQTMEEVHSRMCGAHPAGTKLYDRIKRMGYYWPTMVQDCMDYAKRCEPCQFHANFIHQPPEPLHPTVASWPFEAWGLDVVGPITPKSSAGHSYILAATDYFSK